MIKVCKAMVECLERENIKVVFGYPGAAICPFYDELEKSDVRHILVRHEANAGHGANGYARITGKPAVCIATSGPGATNLITAIATAYMDSIPVVIITGQVNTDQIGRDVFQEADITGSAEPFVKHSYLVRNSEDIPRIFKDAFYIAGTGRPGPVLIDIPYDVQNQMIDFKYPEHSEIRSYKPTVKGNSLQIKRIASALNESKKPLICSGGGIFSADACSELKELSSLCEIPVVSTMMGISAVSACDPLYFGMIGMHGVKAANLAIKECDLLLLIGARVGDRAIKSPAMVTDNTKVIHIDIDPAEIGKNVDVNIPVVGDAKIILQQIINACSKQTHTEWIEKLNTYRNKPVDDLSSDGYVNPKKVVSCLSGKLAPGSTIVADVGQNQIWTASNFKVKDGRFLTSGGMGTMGYSLGAAIGAKLAMPENPVIAICGDGSFQMQMMELATAVQHNVDVKVIVMSNNRLGMVRELQKNAYGNKLTAVFLDGSPDFILLAKAYGINAMRINNDDDIEKAVNTLIDSKGPFLLECVVDPEAPTL